MADFPTIVTTNGDPTSANTLANAPHAEEHQSHNGEIKATQTKIGTGASTPTANKVLRGTGTGTSGWAQVVLSTDVAVATSADLRGVLSDETGTGAAVFGTSPSLTTPQVTTSINDSNGNEVIKTPATGSATNDITVTNAVNGSAPTISASGSSDTNVDLKSTGKGTGKAYSDSVTEFAFDFVVSGLVWSGDSYGASLAASMTAGFAYISGVRVTIAAVTARAFTASKDTYIDLSSGGTITYTEVSNNAASPALSANNIRIGIIQSGATITAVGAVNQGQETKVLPIASSIPYAVTDSLGNLICPRDPNRQLLGYRQCITDISNATTSYADITGLSCPVIIPAGRKIKVSGHMGVAFNGTSTNGGAMNVIDVTASVTLDESQALAATTNGVFNLNPGGQPYTVPASGLRTFKSQLKALTGGTVHTNSSASIPTWIKVELQ